MMFTVDSGRVAVLATALRDVAYQPEPYGFLSHLSGEHRRDRLALFHLIMVAVDHNTHGPDHRYEGAVDGVAFHGSELLFATAERSFRNHAELLTIDGLTALDPSIFATDEGVLPVDAQGRVDQIAAIGEVLRRDWQGSAQGLTSLRSLGGPGGVIDTLSGFPAYDDPIAKKANLLAKVWMREGVFSPDDPQTLALPVDHVVMTMALRSGLLRAVPDVLQRVREGLELPDPVLSELRRATGPAWARVSEAAAIPLADLDDLVWSYGRKALRLPTPLPAADAVSSELDCRTNTEGRTRFIAAMNGLDDRSADSASDIPVIRFAFTRFF